MKSTLKMSDISQVKDGIKKEIEKIRPSKDTILSYLSRLTFNEIEYGKEYKNKYIFLSSTEFYDIIGEIFKLNPRFFMNSLHTEIGRRMRNRYGDEKKKEMDKYIIEKFCLYSGEQILYECHGSIRQLIGACSAIALSGSIFITNYRIIAQGKLNYGDNYIFSSKRINAKKAFIKSSVQRDCYGYIFPIKNLYNLRKTRHSIIYRVKLDNYVNKLRINSTSLKIFKKEHVDKIFKILSNISEDARVGV